MTIRFDTFSDFSQAAVEYVARVNENHEDTVSDMVAECRKENQRLAVSLSEVYAKLDNAERDLRLEQEKLRNHQAVFVAQPPVQPKPVWDNVGAAILRRVAQHSPHVVRAAVSDIFPNQRIEQIKAIRTVFGLGLKEAKEFVEGHYSIPF